MPLGIGYLSVSLVGGEFVVAEKVREQIEPVLFSLEKVLEPYL